MDKRLFVEFCPGIAFLLGNALSGLFLAAILAALATGMAILLRLRWDRTLPWLAISIFVLTMTLLIAALILEDATFIKVSGTIGSLAFAAIIAIGAASNPSMLYRTLSYKLTITDQGWRNLHFAWISLAVGRAAANEVVWRNASDNTWGIYNGLSDFGWFALYYAATSFIAHRYWRDQGNAT